MDYIKPNTARFTFEMIAREFAKQKESVGFIVSVVPVITGGHWNWYVAWTPAVPMR